MDYWIQVLGWIVLLVIAVPQALVAAFDYFTTDTSSKELSKGE